jgi:hypothetical protein
MNDEPRVDLARRADESPAPLPDLTPARMEALVAMLSRAVSLLETLPRLEASIESHGERLAELSAKVERLESASASASQDTRQAVTDLREEVAFVGTQAVPSTMAVLLGELNALRGEVREAAASVAPADPARSDDEAGPQGDDLRSAELCDESPAPAAEGTVEESTPPPKSIAQDLPEAAVQEENPWNGGVEADFEEIVWVDEEPAKVPAPPTHTWPDLPSHDTEFDSKLARLKAQKAEERERWEYERATRSRRSWFARLFGR